jgi:endonuclease/exonuclease/phosphatase (EEP) superfamily protein YafD
MLRLMKPAPAPTADQTAIRVVTLNCAGNPASAAEITRLKPDVVLLQEIPSTNDLARLTLEWFGTNGECVAGLDCAIIARGSLTKLDERPPPQYLRAMLNTPSSGTICVTSIRLVPPVGRLDLWNPEAWRDSAKNRQLRRTQLAAGLTMPSMLSNYPEIVGGDFNAPSTDPAFRLLDKFSDAHREAGRGWGNTVLNNFPIARPDQIRLNRLRAVSVRAIRTHNSDHRMVVADVYVLPASINRQPILRSDPGWFE